MPAASALAPGLDGVGRAVLQPWVCPGRWGGILQLLPFISAVQSLQFHQMAFFPLLHPSILHSPVHNRDQP